MKYYNNNLVYAFRVYLLACTVLVAISGILTLFIVVNNYRSYQKNMQKTYVYSTNGASIQVNLKHKN